MANRKSGKKIDFTRWTFGAFDSALASGSAQGVIVSPATRAQTILRTRGEIVCYADGTQAPAGRVRVGVGFLVQQAGATAVSLPVTDGDSPFFWYEVFIIGYEEMVTDVIDIPGLSMFRKTIDSKAMRIVRADQEVICIAENLTVGSAMTVNLSVSARFLIGE